MSHRNISEAQSILAASGMNTRADDLCIELQRKRAVEKALLEMPPPLEVGYMMFDDGSRKCFCRCERCEADYGMLDCANPVKFQSENPCAEYDYYCRACFPAILLEPEPLVAEKGHLKEMQIMYRTNVAW